MNTIKKTLSLLGLFVVSVLVMGQTSTYDAWFTWTPNPPHELISGYRIEYKKLPAITNWTYLTSVPSSTNVAMVKGLKSGFKYEFRAFAINAFGQGTNLSDIVYIPTNTPTKVEGYQLTQPK